MDSSGSIGVLSLRRTNLGNGKGLGNDFTGADFFFERKAKGLP
jgi:hypothetical protein